MKFPKNIEDTIVEIGTKKFVVVHSLVVIPVEDHELPAGLVFRPGEVSAVTYSADNEDMPFNLHTAHLPPDLVEANTMDGVVEEITRQIHALRDRIILSQIEEASELERAGTVCDHDHSKEDCCRNHDLPPLLNPNLTPGDTLDSKAY